MTSLSDAHYHYDTFVVCEKCHVCFWLPPPHHSACCPMCHLMMINHSISSECPVGVKGHGSGIQP